MSHQLFICQNHECSAHHWTDGDGSIVKVNSRAKPRVTEAIQRELPYCYCIAKANVKINQCACGYYYNQDCHGHQEPKNWPGPLATDMQKRLNITLIEAKACPRCSCKPAPRLYLGVALNVK